MIVYQKTKQEYLKDIRTNAIDTLILELVKEKLKHGVGKSQQLAWKHSLQTMAVLLADPEIPADCGICIEYKIPYSGKLIDFMITGRQGDMDHVIIVELKQWTKAFATDKSGLVRTRFEHGEQDVAHPSYQAWSYAALLEDFNVTVQEENIQLHPCAYLHNYVQDDVLTSEAYTDYVALAPIFYKEDGEKFLEFIKQHITSGDSTGIMQRIDSGKLRPSKSLADSLSSMLGGNREFVLVDEQKVVFENAFKLALQANPDRKRVLIVQGGPGTGKSLVAINLMVALTQERQVVRYVTKNSAPRDVFQLMLQGTLKKNRITSMFSGSGAFYNTESTVFDTLIVDESHRLNEKSGLYGNYGSNQIKELIDAAKVTVFFIDEKQRVTLKDIGSKAEIRRLAAAAGAEVEELHLLSQFRCNGSDAYLNWLDETLGLPTLEKQEAVPLGFDFQVVDSPNTLRAIIENKNLERNKARLVAGYCWTWPNKKKIIDGIYDVVIPEHDFAIRWNLTRDGGLWILNPESVKEIGCIHTCQGLEVDYVGVIVGPDFIIRNGQVITDANKRAKSDMTVRGHKKMSKARPIETTALLDAIIKNTYRTLMTRGMLGCYVYFTDKETELFFREKLASVPSAKAVTTALA
ncbi:DUF2075 domain-containing protein [Hymenobacter negativus]|uniref:DUF2075 domain-containing protein n=1 Tax=Hymenobacter negativus TaxID=2795026 RepID=A0ABS3QA14_9BACT|nr:DUF2075 domain-containing protein [Hymenobacter negativus]MBO2007555.1 DUF2075 domain-containing protein [Hymenobacter negativus]